MFEFLRKVGFFISLFGLYLLGMYLVNLYIIKTEQPLLKNCNVLIAGDSHPQKAFNPALFNSATNIAQTAEPYVVTYFKLKKVLSACAADTLILGFGYHNVSAFNDNKLSDERWSSEMFRRLYPLVDISDIAHVEVNKKGFHEVVFKNMCLLPASHIHYLEEYSNVDISKVSDYRATIRRHYFDAEKERNISSTAILYLDSIIALCKEKNIELILAAHPLYREYYKRVPEKFIRAYNSLKEKFEKEGIVVLDYSREPYDEKVFLNSDHLNKRGADIFTMAVRKQLAELRHEKTGKALNIERN